MNIKTELEHDSYLCYTDFTPLTLLQHNQMNAEPRTTSILQPNQIKHETVELFGDDIVITTRDAVVRSKLPTDPSFWIEIPDDDDILEITTMQNMIEHLKISTPPLNSNKVKVNETTAKKETGKLHQAGKIYQANNQNSGALSARNSNKVKKKITPKKKKAKLQRAVKMRLASTSSKRKQQNSSAPSATSILRPNEMKQEIIDLCRDDIATTTLADDIQRNQLPANASIWIEIPEEDDDILEITTMQKMIESLNISTPPPNSKKKNAKLQHGAKIYRANPSNTRNHQNGDAPCGLRLSIIDLSHPYGRILREDESEIEQTIKSWFLYKMLYDCNNIDICPRYDDIYWYCGRLQITCADEASRWYLKEFVSSMQPPWAGSQLVAINYLEFHKLKRIELYTNKLMFTKKNDFCSLIERQNPELDVSHWLTLEPCPHVIFGAQYSFFVDKRSYKKLRCMNGIVYYGLGRLKFSFHSKRDLNTGGSHYKQIMHFNWESCNQYNFHQ